MVTDVANSQIKLWDGSNCQTIAGCDKGNKDGSKAKFTQLTGVTTEQQSIFVADAAVGRICLISSASSLVRFLKFLNIFGQTVGLHVGSDQPKNITLEETIEWLQTV